MRLHSHLLSQHGILTSGLLLRLRSSRLDLGKCVLPFAGCLGCQPRDEVPQPAQTRCCAEACCLGCWQQMRGGLPGAGIREYACFCDKIDSPCCAARTALDAAWRWVYGTAHCTRRAWPAAANRAHPPIDPRRPRASGKVQRTRQALPARQSAPSRGTLWLTAECRTVGIECRVRGESYHTQEPSINNWTAPPPSASLLQSFV